MNNDNIDRKLVAIMFADIAGYTAVMQQDEPKGRNYIRVFNEEINTTIDSFNGYAVQFYGDGCICIFNSSVKALDCAKHLQKAFKEQGVPVRIGVHSGDAYFDENNVYGDSVNIASRIESIAIPGAVLFSVRVKKDIANQPELKHVFLGSVEFKNVEETVDIYALDIPGLSVPTSVDPSGKLKFSPDIPGSFKKKGLSLIASVIIIALLVTANWSSISKWLSGQELSDEEKTVAVLDFDNISSNEELAVIASMATSRIVHGITQHNLARVVTDEVIENYRHVMKSSVIPLNNIEFLNKEMDVSEVFQGSVYANGNELILECTVLDAGTNEVIKGLPTITGSLLDPMPAIEEQRELILGYIAQIRDKELQLSIETQPPKYAAFKEMLKAKQEFNDVEAEKYLLRAIEIDPNYFEPKVYLVSNYYNQDKYIQADSLLNAIIGSSPDTESRQRNLINFYKALLEGKNNIAYRCMKNELEFTPFDLPTNQSVMVLGTQQTRNLDEALKVYRMIPEDKINLTDCSSCQIRMYVKGYIELEYGDIDKAIETGQKLLKNNGEDWASTILLRAYAMKKNWKALDAFLDQLLANGDEFDAVELYLQAAKESYITGEEDKCKRYASLAINDSDTLDAQLIEALWLKGDSSEAVSLGRTYLKTEPESWRTLTILMAHALIERDTSDVNTWSGQLESQRGPYQYGGVDYALACAYGIAGQDEKALEHLNAAILQGKWNNYFQFQHDFAFVRIRELVEFSDICNYWNE